MSVRVGQFAGLDAVQKIATTLNLSDNVPRGPAIYIGAFETDLKDLTAAYTVFPNAGVRKQAYIIERIDDTEHQPIYRASHIAAPALDSSAAWMTSQLMEEVLTRGTAAAARSLGFKLPAAGKTGTTNDYKDAWFVGYTSTMTCGVWVGFDQPVTIIPHGYGAALHGGLRNPRRRTNAVCAETERLRKKSWRHPEQTLPVLQEILRRQMM